MKKYKQRLDTTTKVDIINMFIAGLALVLSVCSLIYTYYTDHRDNTEIISIIDAGFGYNDTLSYDSSGGYRGQGMIDGINYSVIVTNNSKQTAAIVSSKVQRKTGTSMYSYSRLVNKVKDSNNQEVTFPVTLEAGESILLTFEINTLVPPPINMLILEQFGTSAEIPIDDLWRYLGRNGRDVFGNEVNYVEYSDGTYSTTIDNPRFPVYVLEFTSGRGGIYIEDLTH